MKAYKSHLDKISIGLSALCVIHCILLPLLLTTLPFLGIELLENRSVEWATILCSLLAGGWAIGKGYRNYHQHVAVPVVFAIGFILMILANYTGSHLAEVLLKGSGAVLIIHAHITNWKKSKVCCENALKK